MNTNLAAFFIILSYCISSCGENYSPKQLSAIKRGDRLNVTGCPNNFVKTSFKSELFPFELKNFEINRIRTYFVEGIRVDSVTGNGATTYKFSLNDSWIEFLVKKDDQYFYLSDSKIKTRLFKIERIPIGMNKTIFIDRYKITSKDCDTIIVDEGEMSTYFSFIFGANILREIDIYPTE